MIKSRRIFNRIIRLQGSKGNLGITNEFDVSPATSFTTLEGDDESCGSPLAASAPYDAINGPAGMVRRNEPNKGKSLFFFSF